MTEFPPLEVGGRLDALSGRLVEAEVDGLVVTTLPNIRYLTGFTGSAGILVVTGSRAMLTTDGRYRTQSAEQVAAAGVRFASRDRDRGPSGPARRGERGSDGRRAGRPRKRTT